MMVIEMGVNVRCRRCNARRVLSKHPLDYKNLPCCGTCGTKDKGYRVVKLTKTITCSCMGYPFPHRYLSPNCIERVVAENMDQDWSIFKKGDCAVHGVIKRYGQYRESQ